VVAVTDKPDLHYVGVTHIVTISNIVTIWLSSRDRPCRGAPADAAAAADGVQPASPDDVMHALDRISTSCKAAFTNGLV